MEDILPVGSVILTNDDKKLMIIGYYPDVVTSQEQHDYMCCDATKGLKRDCYNIIQGKDYFNIYRKDIKKVLYIGLQDDTFDVVKLADNTLMKKINEKRKNGEYFSQEVVKEIYDDFLNEVKKTKKEGR